MKIETLKYRVVGEGKPILLVQGGPGFPSESWGSFPEYIASLGFQCIVYDHYYLNEFDTEISEYGINLLMDEIEFIRTKLGIAKLDIFAHSFGAYEVMKYANKYPNRINKLILCSPAPLDIKYIDIMKKEVSKRLIDTQDSAKKIEQRFNNNEIDLFESNVRKSLVTQIFDNTDAKNFSELVFNNTDVKEFEVLYSKVFGAYLDFIRENSVHIELMPLVIHGSQDPLPLESSIDIVKRTNGLQLEIIDHCGHFPFAEKIEILGAYIKKHFN